MAWAKHTGDIAVLSRTDLGVIALTYAAEVETNGFANIREVPGKASTAIAYMKDEQLIPYAFRLLSARMQRLPSLR